MRSRLCDSRKLRKRRDRINNWERLSRLVRRTKLTCFFPMPKTKFSSIWTPLKRRMMLRLLLPQRHQDYQILTLTWSTYCVKVSWTWTRNLTNSMTLSQAKLAISRKTTWIWTSRFRRSWPKTDLDPTPVQTRRHHQGECEETVRSGSRSLWRNRMSWRSLTSRYERVMMKRANMSSKTG